MKSPSFSFLFLFLFFSVLVFSHAEQSYTKQNSQLDCYSTSHNTTLGYTCDADEHSCPTYLTFRSQTDYQTPSQMASLLNCDSSAISKLNGFPNNYSVPIDELVFIPTTCSCSGSYYQYNTSYTVKANGETYLSIANNTYQGMTTCRALISQNPNRSRELTAGMKIQVPLRCSCLTPDQITKSNIKYLVAYLVAAGDDLHFISQKFNVDDQSVLDANGLSKSDAIYPFTTLLIPSNTELTKAQIESFQPNSKPAHGSTKKYIYIATGIGAGVLIFCLILSRYLCCYQHKLSEENSIMQDAKSYFRDPSNGREKGNDIDLPIFDFATIAAATNNFDEGNKLGEGGFGPVYKGQLDEDREIAVKRLSKTSQQGAEEFKNEVMLIAKLQHINLVRLLGCCIQGQERMLIYEFMPNKSLDAFLFGKGGVQLDWKMRYQIIIGITRGLLYLHHDSRFRVIHRDLKASNILLDKDMNPKISDFGMARIFGGDETNFNTRKVVGTYGYMSPEYVLEGIFSLKSDVFSFGVLVLEILSGKKNRGVYTFSPHLNLLAHAWGLWNEGKSLQLVYESIIHSSPTNEILKCIKIGLLCVQEHPEDRPLMSSVYQMLGNEIASLPKPKQPGFVARYSPVETSSSSSSKCTVNDVTLTRFEGR